MPHRRAAAGPLQLLPAWLPSTAMPAAPPLPRHGLRSSVIVLHGRAREREDKLVTHKRGSYAGVKYMERFISKLQQSHTFHTQ